MKKSNQSDHLYHAVSLSIIHLKMMIDKGSRAVSGNLREHILDFGCCTALLACLTQLQSKQAPGVTQALTLACAQLAKELNYSFESEASQTIVGILDRLQSQIG